MTAFWLRSRCRSREGGDRNWVRRLKGDIKNGEIRELFGDRSWLFTAHGSIFMRGGGGEVETQRSTRG